MRKSAVLLVSLCLAGLTLAPPAAAAGLSPPVADCYAHGTLTHHYPAAELSQALATMPADIAEYSPCRDVLQRALYAGLGKLGGGSGGSGGGGSFLPTWLLVVLALLVLGGAAFGVIAMRNRQRTT
jgi:hypothetical protein